MNITKNFTLEELTNSPTAKRKGIDNTPNKEQINNLTALCKNILQPIREIYGKPIIVSSGYRCNQLNTAIGGSPTSEHRYGMAADIHSISDTREDNKELWDIIRKYLKDNNVGFGQLINEFDYNWIHISYNPKNQRKQVLKAYSKNGKTAYSVFNG